VYPTGRNAVRRGWCLARTCAARRGIAQAGLMCAKTILNPYALPWIDFVAKGRVRRAARMASSA